MIAWVQKAMVKAICIKFSTPLRLEKYGRGPLCKNKSTCTKSAGIGSLGKPKVGGKPSAVWERMAVAVKYTEKERSTKYVETIRATHDPTQDLKAVEDELKGTIGKALGRQGHKIIHAKQLMEKELHKYNDLIASQSSVDKSKACADIINSARNYNEYRKQALHARWELTVQRQAAGFIVNNNNYVMDHYPIDEALPTYEDIKELDDAKNDSSTTLSSLSEKDQKEKFTGHWWEHVGRWR